MNFLHTIQSYYHNYVTRYDKALVFLMLINTLLGCLYILINKLFFQFSGLNFLSTTILYITPGAVIICLLSIYLRKDSPNSVLVIHTYSIIYIFIFSLAISDNGTQYTPFHPIDAYLAKIDQWINMNTSNALTWSHQYPTLTSILNFSYFSLEFELVLLPLLVTLLRCKNTIRLYLMAGIIGYIFIEGLYYFLPTVAPAGIFHNSLFSHIQHQCYTKFQQVHHHLKVTGNGSCFVSFPSPHVFCATILIYLCREKRWLFIPILVLNSIMISATVLLGYHYFVDVIGGLSVATLSLWIAHRIDQWILRDPKSKALLC